MRPETSRIQRMLIPMMIRGSMVTKPDDIQNQKNLIFGEHGLLFTLEKQLNHTGAYICGNALTVVDLVIYCEIATILAILKNA